MYDKLIYMMQATDKQGWEIIRGAFKDRVLGMMRNPDELAKFLDDFQPNAKRMLIAPAEERVIRTQAKKIGQLYKTGFREAAERQTRNRAFLDNVIDTNSTAQTDAMIAFIQERGGPLLDSYQHAIMDAAIDRSMVTTKEGVERISGKAMKKVLYGEDGKSGFFGKGLLEPLHP
jgi:hypothetical protein